MATQDTVRAAMAEFYPAPYFDKTVADNYMDSLTLQGFVLDLEDRFEVEIPQDWLYRDTLGELAEKIAAMTKDDEA